MRLQRRKIVDSGKGKVMERLTEQERNSDGTGISKQSLIDRPGKGYPSSYSRKILTKLAEYEDLEEQCINENTWGLKTLLKKWKEFFEDIQELYEYRKLKKQGRLPELPCAVGDKIYDVGEGFIEPCTVEVISLADYKDRNGKQSYIMEIHYEGEDCPWVSTEVYFTDIGKTVFLTRKEAEQALKEEMEEEEK